MLNSPKRMIHFVWMKLLYEQGWQLPQVAKLFEKKQGVQKKKKIPKETKIIDGPMDEVSYRAYVQWS